MKKFLKKSIVAVAACATLLGSLSVSAAGPENIKENEQNVLDWLASRPASKVGVLADLTKEQFEYTPGDISAEDAEKIKKNLADADDAVAQGATIEDLVDLADETAQLIGGAVTVVDGEAVFVRYLLDADGNPTDEISEIIVMSNQNEYEKIEEGSEGVIETEDGKYYQLVEGGVSIDVSPVDVTYSVHVQSAGDQAEVKNGASAGTTGSAKRLERISIKVAGSDDLGIEYTTHVQSYGWMPWAANGEKSGTEGEAKRLEAIKIRLTGDAADYYNVYYRVHAQSRDWMGWAKNGETAGTAGYAKRLEAIQIVVVPKWDNEGKLDESKYTPASKFAAAYDQKPGADNVAVPESVVPTVMYQTHVQSIGWQKWAANGAMAGTQGQYKRLEGIKLQLTNKDFAGSIEYSTHVEKIGWQAPVKDGQLAGTQGQYKRLEAIKINLTGEIANHYDVYYRVHAQSKGWMGWAKNGEEAGTSGQAKRLEGIQVVLVPKGGAAPADNFGGIQTAFPQAFEAK